MRSVPISCGAFAGVKGFRFGAATLCPRSFSSSPAHHHRTLHTIQGRLNRPTARALGRDVSRKFVSTIRYYPSLNPESVSLNPKSLSLNPESVCLKVSKNVKTALRYNQPVVALESTIYTHGFPYPQNVDLALRLEEIVRSHGAVPATIGILNGVARVGLTDEEIIMLASSAGKPETMKVSRRDLPYILGMVSCPNPFWNCLSDQTGAFYQQTEWRYHRVGNNDACTSGWY